jgi:hypothetical protein
MSSSRQSILLFAAVALIAAGAAARAAPAPSIRYKILAPDAAGHPGVACQPGASAACVFWIGDPAQDRYRVVLVDPGATRTLKDVAAGESYCVDVVDHGRPAWPGCLKSPLAGRLDRPGEASFFAW